MRDSKNLTKSLADSETLFMTEPWKIQNVLKSQKLQPEEVAEDTEAEVDGLETTIQTGKS